MFDPYLIKYLCEFLVQCNNCKCYQIYYKQNTCFICKKFFCKNCTSQLYYNYNHCETSDRYCLECDKNSS